MKVLFFKRKVIKKWIIGIAVGVAVIAMVILLL